MLSLLSLAPHGFSVAPVRVLIARADAVRNLAARFGMTAPHGWSFVMDSGEMIAARVVALSAANGGE